MNYLQPVSEPVLSTANILQHSPEWWLARRGKITASRMKTVMDGGARAWQTLADKLVAERLMETMPDPDAPSASDYVKALMHGIQYEPIARTNAELALNADFDLVGFVQHHGFDFIGASPDALNCGFPVEIKCPYKLERHMEVYRTQRMPDEHMPQVQCQIACCGSPGGFFVSYSPTPQHWKMRTIVLDIPRDQDYIDMMMERCQRFKSHVLDHEPLVRPVSTVKRFF